MRDSGTIFTVIRRELHIWRKRPLYLMGAILPLLCSTVFYTTFFGVGMPSKLPIAVVDYDNSSLTRNFIRQLDATQLGQVIEYQSYSEAREDMQKGKITSICVLPNNLYADVQAHRQPKFTFYINGLYFVGGALAYKDILTMINLCSGAVHREVLRAKGLNEYVIGGLIRPVDIDIHQIGNTTTNYGVYLNSGLLPGVLAMSVILVLIYSLGTELKYGTSKHLLGAAGGSILKALAGKLVLYTVLFFIIGASLVCFLYVWLQYPFSGNILWLFLDILLLILASEAVAVTIIGLVPICRFALSIGALYSVLAFSMSGFSLPVETLMSEIQGFAIMFPLRHYYQFFVQEGMFASGFAGWYPEVMHLLVFLLVPFIVIKRLERAYINQDYSKN